MRFWEYFSPPDEERAEDDVETAMAVFEFSRSPYWKILRDWLDLELSRPFPISDQMAMIQSGVRANTLRELKAKIERDVVSSVEILKSNGKM